MAEFKWYGHNCFRIRAREATVLTDPFERSLPKLTADVVTLSHDEAGHPGLDRVQPDYQLIRGPGEYEVHDIFVTGIRTYRDDARGQQLGHNTVYLIEIEGMIVCHLGDLGHALTEEQAEAMSNVDVLLIPAGGPVLDPAKAAEVVSQLEPKLVIPMRLAAANGGAKSALDAFCSALGVEVPPAEDKLTLRQSDLGEPMRLVVLRPEGDGAKR